MNSTELQIKLKKVSLRVTVLYESVPKGKFNLVNDQNATTTSFPEMDTLRKVRRAQATNSIKSRLGFAYQETGSLLFSIEHATNIKVMNTSSLRVVLKEANEVTRILSGALSMLDNRAKHK